MKLFGNLKELVSLVFRKDTREVTVQPNGGTYTGPVTLELPPVLSGSDIVLSENATQAMTNKTIDGDSNTLQDMPVTIFKTVGGDANEVILRDGSGATTSAKIADVNVDNAAAIARSKLGLGTVSHVVINDGSGNFSSEAQLAKSRGGAGADMTNVTFPSTGTLVTRDATETLLNKTVVSSTGAITGALTLPSGTTAQQPTPSNGMIRYNTDNGAFEGYAAGAWAGIGGGGTTDKISQVGHGFVVGDLLYLNGSVYTKAIATSAGAAEVVGMVSRIIDSATFDMTLSGEVSGLTGLTAGEAYFLSPSSAGGFTVTEPTTIGQVSVPIGVASSTTTMYVMPKRGSVVGGTNARTEISLSNNASTNTQLVTAYDAGEMTGWVVITGTTSYRFYVAVQFSKNAAGSDYNVSYQTSGETPPAGFSIQYSANYITVTLPNVAGFSSAKLNYALNAPAVGATFPLAVDASVITAGTVAAARLPVVVPGTSAGVVAAAGLPGNTTGSAIAAGYVGEEKRATFGLTNANASTVWKQMASITLTPGVWLMSASGTLYRNGATLTDDQDVAVSTTSASGAGATPGLDWVGVANPVLGNATATTVSYTIVVSSTTTYYLNTRSFYSAGTPQWRGAIIATRIA